MSSSLGSRTHRQRCDAVSAVLKALAHPVRLCIATGVLTHECNVSRMVQRLALRQPVVSQHLRVLVRAGVLVARRDGTRRCYRVVEPGPKKIVEALARLL
mgnify:FL=1|jgi:ArsR family transcriptional regulator